MHHLPEGQGYGVEGHHEGIYLEHAPYVSGYPCSPIHPLSPWPSENIKQQNVWKLIWLRLFNNNIDVSMKFYNEQS